MSNNMSDDQRKIMNLVGQNFISLRGIYRRPAVVDDRIDFNFSGFVFNLRDDWFLFTAGHVLKNIAQARDANMTVESFYLDDAYRPDAPFAKTEVLIPFDFDNAPKHFIDQPELGDFAAIWLRQNYRDLLSQNGIKPFSPEETSSAPYDPRFISYWLIGLPEELMSVEGEGSGARQKSQLVIIRVDPIRFEDLPDIMKLEVEKKGFHKDNFFARIPDASELTAGEDPGLQSIVGMSGGPIIGWRRNESGGLGYNLVAVQSIWWEPSRILMACTAARYISALDRTIQTASVRIQDAKAD